MHWNARERRICTSGYWQVAFPHLQVRKNTQEQYVGRYSRNGRIRPVDNICAEQLITNKTQVQTEKKKGKCGIEYSLASASDGPRPRGWRPTLKMEFPHLRFSTLTTGHDHSSPRTESREVEVRGQSRRLGLELWLARMVTRSV